MEVVWFDEIDSTSNFAAEKAPQAQESFVVAAGKQTAGRGRRGRTWESPSGGLYLTLALKEKIDNLGLMPLRVGLCLAQWIQARFHLRVTLKWPNDLLVDGKKLAGILCESSIQAGKVGHVLAGIGLNVGIVPQLEGAYHATSLEELLGKRGELDVKLLLDEFLSFWEAFSLDDAAVVESYERQMIQPHYAWLKAGEDQAAYFAKSVNMDGTLVMTSEGGNRVTLNSVDHDFTCELPNERSLLAIAEVGNSSIKLFDTDGKVKRLAANEISRETLERWVDGHSSVYYTSTNGRHESLFLQACREAGVRATKVGKARIRSWGDYPVEQLGSDRLALIEGYLAENLGKPAVLVSLGTATTVDVVAGDGRHLGGWIIPGLELSAAILAERTELPPVEINPSQLDVEPVPLGQDTRSAIINGVLATVRGLTANQPGDVIIDREEIDRYLRAGIESLARNGI